MLQHVPLSTLVRRWSSPRICYIRKGRSRRYNLKLVQQWTLKREGEAGCLLLPFNVKCYILYEDKDVNELLKLSRDLGPQGISQL